MEKCLELGNQQERRSADLHWFAGFFDGEGCLSIVQHKKRRFTQFAVSARLVNSSVTAIQMCSRVLEENSVPFHLAWGAPSAIGTRPQARITISGMKRTIRFLDVVRPHLRIKSYEATIVTAFIKSRIAAGRKGQYSDDEIEMFLDIRKLHGYRLSESPETLRKTLVQRRYSPNSARKTETAAEMTVAAS